MRFGRHIVCVALVSCLGCAAPSHADVLYRSKRSATPVGHGGIEYFNPAARRFSGTVVAVGAPDAKGRIVSFTLAPLGPGATPPAANSMVGWRLTFLAGKRYSSAFEIRSNTASEIVVVLRGSTLKGVAAKDIFVVDEPDPQSPWADDLRFDSSH
jgi:hypothetical protein